MAVVTFTAVPGTTYRVAVDGYDGSVGNISIGISDEGGGTTLPVNAVGIADFVNGGYQWDATALVASDVVDHPELILPSSGLVIGDISTVELIGDLASYLLAGDWTIVITWSRSETLCCPIHLQDSADDNPRFSLEERSYYFLAYDVSGDVGTERDNEDDVAHGSDNSAAITRTDAKLVSSFNGRAIVSRVVSQTGFAAVNTVLLGGSSSGSFGAMTLKKIVIYPPQADADLPGLSVLS